MKIEKNQLHIARNGADITEFAFPAGDDAAGEAIAGDVDGGASHVDEGVDAEDDEDGFSGKVKGCRGCEKNEERGARNACNTFAGKHKRENHQELLRPGHVNAGGLGDEDGSEREVERGAVEIEAVTRRNNKGDDAARNAKGFHAFHRARECGFGSAGGESDGGGFGNGAEEMAKRYFREKRDRQKNEKQERDESAVRGKKKLDEREKNSDPHVADGVSHGRADADGREVHDEICETKHDLSERFGKAEDWFLKMFGHASESDGKKNCEDGDLKDLVFGDGLGDIFRKNVEEEVGPAEWSHFWRGLCGRRRGDYETFAGFA